MKPFEPTSGHPLEDAPPDWDGKTPQSGGGETLCPHKHCDAFGKICDPDACLHWQEQRCNGVNWEGNY